VKGKRTAVPHNNGFLSSVERYDPALDAWEAVAPMAAARVEHAVAVLDGKLYAAGGLGADYSALSSVERYDPALDAWEAVAPMAEARMAHAVAVLDGKLYAVGGLWRTQLACATHFFLPLSSGSAPCSSRRWARRRARRRPCSRVTAGDLRRSPGLTTS